MSDYAFEYLLVGMLWLLSIFSFIIGMEQMIKIVISNYIINIICLASSNAISLLTNFLEKTPDTYFLAISYAKRQVFFSSGQTTIILILYGLLLIAVFNYSKIHITFPQDPIINNTIQILLIPLTVFSVIFSLQIAIFGDQIVNIEHTSDIANKLSSNASLHQIIVMTPIRIAIHALCTLWLTTQIGVSYQSPQPPAPVFE